MSESSVKNSNKGIFILLPVLNEKQNIAELLDRIAGMNLPGELMDREVGPLPRAVNRKVTQRDDPHSI